MGNINFINNGVYSIGNDNTNIVNHEINYQDLLNELYILKENSDYDINNLIEACKQKNYNKLVNGLKKLNKELFHLIKELGLALLVNFIENNL